MKAQHNNATRSNGTVTTLAKYLQVFLLLGLYLVTLPSYAADAKAKKFDHDNTGFVLTGEHAKLTCDTCHIRGIFKGIPRRCEGCHATVSQISATKKPSTHIQSTHTCDDCHLDTAWKPARVEHASIFGSCVDCHNDVKAKGKKSAPKEHPPTDDNCADCHSTTSWLPAYFNHRGITGGCVSCHNNVKVMNGKTVIGKPGDHIVSDDNCQNCHVASSRTFKNGVFSHSNVIAGCVTCHDGKHTGVKGSKLQSHLPSSDLCGSCHTTSSFRPYFKMDHDQTTATCITCHTGNIVLSNNITIMGKITGHDALPAVQSTSNACRDCHNTNTFKGAGAGKPPNHDSKTSGCTECHGKTARGLTIPPHINLNPTGLAKCENCHTTASFTPRKSGPFHQIDGSAGDACVTCHSGSFSISTGPIKSAPKTGHTTDTDCAKCHSQTAFKPVLSTSHTTNQGADCYTGCHDGAHSPADGKLVGNTANGRHLATDNTCNACHPISSSWTSYSKFDHAHTNATCQSCHTGQPFGVISTIRGTSSVAIHTTGINGVTIKVAATSPCADCHTSASFTPNRLPFTHADLTDGGATCANCHSNVSKVSKKMVTTDIKGIAGAHDAMVMKTSTNCSACHRSTTTFAGMTAQQFVHSETTATCKTCHGVGAWRGNMVVKTTNDPTNNGVATHFNYTGTGLVSDCDTCHKSTAGFDIGADYIHGGSFSSKAGDHATGSIPKDECYKCHKGNALTVTYEDATYPGTCSACHMDTFLTPKSQNEHKDIANKKACNDCHSVTKTSWQR
jgi:hypothetical protein